MKQPRDHKAELAKIKEAEEKVKARRISDLGTLCISTGAADAFAFDVLAGVLLSAVEEMQQSNNGSVRYAEKGAAFFREPSTRKPRAQAAVIRPQLTTGGSDAA